MQQLSFEAISVDTIKMPLYEPAETEVSVLRLDKIHAVISGNKWFKLRFYVQEALDLGRQTIVTFGGAYSNHIVATAAASQLHGLRSAGIIRGEEPAALSPTLQAALQYGMRLYFVSRDEYSRKQIPAQLTGDSYYLVNEGGYGKLGASGAATIADHYKGQDFTHVCCAVGTGTMMAGLINASLLSQTITGISVMKNNTELEPAVNTLIKPQHPAFNIVHDYHFGGYAKHKPELIRFMNMFYMGTGIPSDFVYTAKLFYAINDLLKNKFFPIGSKILIIHSGGLQGNMSLSKGTLIF